MSKRVGVYGGMFDPVHCGHLAVATLAADALNLNRVLLVPCKQPNHRNAASASGAQRLEMLTLACADRAQLEASSIELEREGISFSVDTLAQLREEQPDTAFVFILGRDAFENLPRWERWQQLLDENLLAVVSRPSVAISRESAEVTKLAERQVSSPEALFNAVAGKVNSEQLAELAVTALGDMKGQDIRSISVQGLTSITDFMIIVTGTSSTHVKALADSVDKAAKEAGQVVKSIEGKIAAEWVLVDLGDVVVHLMVAPMRALYNLEELWSFKPAAEHANTETTAEHEA